MVKKLIAVALLGAMLFCAGCGKTAEDPSTQPTVQTTQPTQAVTESTEATTLPQETVPVSWTFPEGTVIAGVDVSELEVNQACLAVETAVAEYALEVSVNNKAFQITPEQVGLTISDARIQSYAYALEKGEECTAPVPEYNSELLEDYLNTQCQTAAVNASVKYNSSKDAFEVSKERSGVSVDMKYVTEQITAALENLRPVCKVSVAQKIVNPTVLQDDPRLKAGAEKANDYLKISLTYVYAPEQVTASSQRVTADDIGKMIAFDKNFEPYVSADAVKRYASSMNDKYAVRARFKTTGGGYISINTSSISQAVDTAALAEDLKICLENGTGGTRNAPYKAPTGSATIWNGNYVEVDLTRQHLWVYKDGNCVVSTPIVSGCVAEDMETPTGVYSINYKTRNITLRGPTWNDFVYYWMPFYGNYGFHDATWRSAFGGDIYLYEGSHGCVNIPVDAAAQVYANISAGTKVILYGGVTDVKLSERVFSGTNQYFVAPEAEAFRLDIASADAPTLSYVSDAPEVAEVSADGTVTVKGVGTAKITVSAPAYGKYAAGSVTVTITVAGDCGGEHSYTWTTVKKPTCEEGLQTGLCQCGHKVEEVIAPVRDHLYGEWQEETAPGCETEGKQTCTCMDCGAVKSEPIGSTGHDFTGGNTCSSCGKEKEE